MAKSVLLYLFISHMPKIFVVLLSLFFFRPTNAQMAMAIIKDPDGFCNIREHAAIKSKIQDTVSNGRFVCVFEEEAKENWLLVDYKKGDKTLSGYVHKSRITFLGDLEKFKVTTLNDTVLILELSDMLIAIRKGKFTSKGRQIIYEKPSNRQQLVKNIDGRFPWGTDGNIPKNEYKQIQFKSGNHILTFPKISFSDFFEPNLGMTSAYLDKATNTIYLQAMNGDGAGGYVSVWAVKNEQVIQRETFIPF